MPTYVYECAKCGDEFELYQSFSDEPLKKHPGCGGKATKVFQPVGIVLKGSGFYKNDSRGGAKRSSTTSTESKGDSAATKPDSSGTPKTDSSKSSPAKDSGSPKSSGAGSSTSSSKSS